MAVMKIEPWPLMVIDGGGSCAKLWKVGWLLAWMR